MFAKIYLEITNVCNLACSFCAGTTRKKHFMTREEFAFLADRLRPYTDFLYFHLMGEPTAHPLIGDFLATAHARGFRVILTTNGTLLPKVADTLLAASQQRLAQGDTLLIFPEGTRTRVGEAMTLQRGAANIAVRCNSAVRVVVIHCSERMLDKQSSWYNVPPNKPVFTVDVRERINIHDFYDASQHEPALAARQLNRHMQHQLITGLQSLSGTKDASALS